MELIPIIHAAAIATGVALAGVAVGALTPAAGLAAIGVGTAVAAGTGWVGLVGLGAFFFSSSTVSRLTERFQPVWVDAKGNRRDPWQVWANGGVAAVGGLLGLLGNDQVAIWIALPSLAAAAADTWATSVGALSKSDPIHVWHRLRVPKGTSGGVSLIGTLGGIAGAGMVAFLPGLVGAPPVLCRAAFLIGILGMVADSILGGTVQGRYEGPACGLPSERARHRCGARTRWAGGLPWLGNDGVNLFATLLAGLAGWGWWAVCCSA
jgi:uncharacterized protein (TIGR00297 family)